MKLINKNMTVYSVVIGIIAFIIGLLTLVFSILNIAKVGHFESTIVLRITIGVMLCILGLANAVVLLINRGKLNISAIAGNAVVIGFGIFLFLNQSKQIINQIVGVAFPIVVASFGAILLVKSIVELSRGNGGSYVFALIVGLALLIGGILFAVFHVKLQDFIWLVVGLAIMISSVSFIVLAARKKAAIQVQVVDNK